MLKEPKEGDIVRIKLSHINHINFKDGLIVRCISPDISQVLVCHDPIVIKGKPQRMAGLYLVDNECLRPQNKKLALPI